MPNLKEKLFGKLDFQTIGQNPDFKEDSVREVIVLPILRELGYQESSIFRSKTLKHPFLKIGSKKRPIRLIPDYSLKVADNFAWVLDAKSPLEKVNDSDNVEQVYSYAAHPEIRSTYFALCNGLNFSLYRNIQNTDNPLLCFAVNEIENHWEELAGFLSPDSFQIGKSISYENTVAPLKSYRQFDYHNRPLLEEIAPKRQSVKRHKGVHGYFTRQVWNVVQEYIRNFSQKGDLVLDPFGGSGVTAIEAMMIDRRAIHIDLNPLSAFLVNNLTVPVRLVDLQASFERLKTQYLINEPKTDNEIKKAIEKYPYPKGFVLPKGSDVNVIEELFTQKQLAQLAFLKYLINKEKVRNIRQILLLSFSSALYKLNKTYQAPKNISDGGGNSGIFAYYRYRVAPQPADVNVWECFENRFQKIVAAKREIEHKINENTIQNLQIIQGTATDLSRIPKESVDYIYTDPPYGKKIPYLDLSVMWNAWLDLDVSEQDYELEAIEGGEHQKSKEDYNRLIAQSIREMYRVLKFDRWMSFVFAHKDPEFWHLITETAESCGFEYAGAVPQKNGQTSFKKRQHPFTVLSGQLIINFRKVRNPKAILKAHLGMNIAEVVMQTIEGVIAKNNGALIEQINDELIIKGMELGFLDLLKKEYSDLTTLLMDNFCYSETTQQFTIRENVSFKTHVDVKLRIRYYLISFLRRMELEHRYPPFDEIVLHIMPLLKNGVTPENQTILSVLEDIGEQTGQDGWRLKTGGQQTFFGEKSN